MNVSTPSRLQDLHLPEMPDRASFEMPDFEMPDIDVSKIDVSKIDVPKALTSAATTAATAVGLDQAGPAALAVRAGRRAAAGRRCRRSPLNWTAVRARLEAAARWPVSASPRCVVAGRPTSRSPSRPPTPPRSARPRRPARSARTIPTASATTARSVADPLDSEAYVGV